MSENIGENLDSLMVGAGDEKVSEATSEQIAVRAAAAAQKMKKLRKDEGAAKEVDEKLAKILPTLSLELLTFVAALIDFHISSLTILACIGLGQKHIESLYRECLKDQIIALENSLPSSVFESKAISTEIDLWWQYIIEADRVSKTIHLAELKTNKKFVEIISQGLAKILKNFLDSKKVIQFNKKELETILNQRGKALFTKE